MVPTKKDDASPVSSEKGGKYSKETGYFDPKTCSQCIVVQVPYPSSLGGVYQPVRTATEAPSAKGAHTP